MTREEIIRDLSERSAGSGADQYMTIRCDVAREIVRMLKEREPQMVVQTTSTIRCPGCGKQITSKGAIKGAIHKEIKYCWKCGQAVKWDGERL